MGNLLFVALDNTVDRTAGFERWGEVFLRGIGRYSDEEMRWLRFQDGDGMALRQTFFKEARTRYVLPQSTGTLVARTGPDG